MTLPICKGVTKAGTACTYRGRHEGFCKIHAPKKLEDCPICYEEITEKTSTTTRCKHVFHKTCLERWMEEKTNCPMCRENIRPTTGQLRLSPPALEPPPAPQLDVALGTPRLAAAALDPIIRPINSQWLGVQQELSGPVLNINSDTELNDFLIVTRNSNSPIVIRFFNTSW